MSGVDIVGALLLGSDEATAYNNAPVNIYRRSTSQPALPSAPVTYTFSTGAADGLNNGWTTYIPAGTDPVWVAVATASAQATTDTMAPNEWAGPVQAFANGAAGSSGVNSKPLFAYQRAASAPPAPSQNATYTFSTQVLAGLNNGWSATIPDGSGIVWVTTASALSPTDVDNINPGEWAAVAKLVQDGTAGTDGFTIKASPATFVIPAASKGAARPPWAGGSCRVTLIKGGAEVTADSYSVVSAVNMASIAISGQDITFADTTADEGSFVARATRGGVNYDMKVNVSKVRDGSAAFRSGNSGSGTVGGTVEGNTTVPGGRTLRISASAGYNTTTNGLPPGQYRTSYGHLDLYWRNITDNGPWNLIGSFDGSEARTTNNGYNEFEPEYDIVFGSVSGQAQFAGPADKKQLGYRATFGVKPGTGNMGNYNLSVLLEAV